MSIAYIDSWNIKRGVRTLVRRLVGHGKSLSDLHVAIAKLPSEDQSQVVMDYASAPADDALDVHYDLRQ